MGTRKIRRRRRKRGEGEEESVEYGEWKN